MAKISKRVTKNTGLVDRTKAYELKQALDLVKKTATAKFDESIDVAVNLGIDAKKSDQVVRGSVVLGTAAGDLDVGIAAGTAAWLELNTGFGHMRNLLENATRPEGAAETVEVRGRTSYGDITVHRS